MSINGFVRKMMSDLVNVINEECGRQNTQTKPQDPLAIKNQNSVNQFVSQLCYKSSEFGDSDYELSDRKPAEIKKILENEFNLRIETNSIIGKAMFILAAFGYGIIKPCTREFHVKMVSKLDKECEGLLAAFLSIILNEKKKFIHQEAMHFIAEGTKSLKSSARKFSSIKEIVGQMTKEKIDVANDQYSADESIDSGSASQTHETSDQIAAQCIQQDEDFWNVRELPANQEIDSGHRFSSPKSEKSDRKLDKWQFPSASPKSKVSERVGSSNFSRIKELESQLKDLMTSKEAELAGALEKNENMKKELREIETMNRTLKDQLAEVKRKLSVVEQQAKQQKKSFDDRSDKIEKKLSQYISANERLDKENKNLKAEVARTNQSSTQLNAKIENSLDQIAWLQDALNSSTEEVEAKDCEIEGLKREVLSLKHDLEQNQKKISGLVDNNKSLTKKLNSSRSSAKHHDSISASRANEIRAEYETKIDSLQTKLADKIETIAVLGVEIKELTQKAKNNRNKIEKVQNYGDRQTWIKKGKKLEAEVRTLKIDLRQIRIQRAERDQELTSTIFYLKHQNKQISVRNIRLENDRKRLLEMIQRMKFALVDHVEKIEILETDKDKLNEHISKLAKSNQVLLQRSVKRSDWREMNYPTRRDRSSFRLCVSRKPKTNFKLRDLMGYM